MYHVDDHDEDEVFEDSLSEPAEDDDDLNNDGSEGIVNDDSDKEEYSNANEDDDGEVAEPTKKEQGTMVLSANDAVALFQKSAPYKWPIKQGGGRRSGWWFAGEWGCWRE